MQQRGTDATFRSHARDKPCEDMGWRLYCVRRWALGIAPDVCRECTPEPSADFLPRTVSLDHRLGGGGGAGA
eukprot:13830627-Alexandrium_andersonii.AAC.1